MWLIPRFAIQWKSDLSSLWSVRSEINAVRALYEDLKETLFMPDSCRWKWDPGHVGWSRRGDRWCWWEPPPTPTHSSFLSDSPKKGGKPKNEHNKVDKQQMRHPPHKHELTHIYTTMLILMLAVHRSDFKLREDGVGIYSVWHVIPCSQEIRCWYCLTEIQ